MKTYKDRGLLRKSKNHKPSSQYQVGGEQKLGDIQMLQNSVWNKTQHTKYHLVTKSISLKRFEHCSSLQKKKKKDHTHTHTKKQWNTKGLGRV